jgi:hypothetical protein
MQVNEEREASVIEGSAAGRLNQPRIVGLYHLSEVACVDVTNR